MNCNKVEQLLSAYIDSELSGVEMLKIRKHLQTCAECQILEIELRSLKQLLMESPVVPEIDISERILLAVNAIEPHHRVRQFAIPGLAVGVSLIAFLTFAFGIIPRVEKHSNPSNSVRNEVPLATSRTSSTNKLAKSGTVTSPSHEYLTSEDQAYYQASDPLSGPATPVLYAER